MGFCVTKTAYALDQGTPPTPRLSASSLLTPPLAGRTEPGLELAATTTITQKNPVSHCEPRWTFQTIRLNRSGQAFNPTGHGLPVVVHFPVYQTARPPERVFRTCSLLAVLISFCLILFSISSKLSSLKVSSRSIPASIRASCLTSFLA